MKTEKKIGDWVMLYEGGLAYQIQSLPNAFASNRMATKKEIAEAKSQVRDSVVEDVIDSFRERSSVGINKYNTTLDRSDLKPLEWLQHLQEELMDATLYIEKLKREL